jgi:hypothetical protein
MRQAGKDFQQMGLQAAVTTKKRRGDASYLEPAKSTTVNNAGVDQAGRDDAGEA